MTRLAGAGRARQARQLPAILLWTNKGLGLHIGQYRITSAGSVREGHAAGGMGRQKEAKMSIEQFIDNEVKSNDVVLFMKGTPQFPQCGFSGQVVQILDHVGVGYKGLTVSAAASA